MFYDIYERYVFKIIPFQLQALDISTTASHFIKTNKKIYFLDSFLLFCSVRNGKFFYTSVKSSFKISFVGSTGLWLDFLN